MTALPMRAQLLLVLQSMLLGAGLALVYDILRAIRWYFAFGRGRTALCDALFWLVLLCALFEFNIALAAGQSRYYILAGAAGGAWLYFATLSRVTLALLNALFRLFARLYSLMARAFTALRHLMRLFARHEKIVVFTKKFAKPPSIFRRKGIK